MIEDPVAEHREVTEVVFTAADLISGSSESERAKVSETLLNILEGTGQKLEHQESLQSRLAVILRILL